MDNIFEEIRRERQHQVERWGNDVDDSVNTPWMWASYIAQYATSWMRGTFAPIDRTVTDAFRQSMVKVATLAVAAIESIDRQRNKQGTTFFEKQDA